MKMRNKSKKKKNRKRKRNRRIHRHKHEQTRPTLKEKKKLNEIHIFNHGLLTALLKALSHPGPRLVKYVILYFAHGNGSVISVK